MLFPPPPSCPTSTSALVCTVEDIQHEFGPRLAAPLQRGAIAAVLTQPVRRPLRRRHPADDGSAQAARHRRWRARLRRGARRPARIEGYGKGALIGAGRRARARRALARARRLRHARPARRLARDRAVDHEDRRRPAPRSTCRIHHRVAAYVRSHFDAMEVRVAGAPRPDEMLLVIAMSTGPRAACARRRPAGRRDCEVRRAALASAAALTRHERCMRSREFNTTGGRR